MRPFRVGAAVWTAASRADWAGKARWLEDLGFSTLLIADHLAELLPPLVPLVSAAEATARLRVGTFVLNNDFRHPAMLARDAAAVDLLSDGRLELGIGAGHMKPEYDAIGLPFDPPAVRVERLGESVRILKRLLAGETVTFAGRHYAVTEHAVYPRPAQRPRPPLLIGGNGRGVLALAAREAEIVSFVGFGHTREGEVRLSAFTEAGTERRVGWVREAAGPRFDALELNALVQRVVVTDRRHEAAEDLAAELPGLTPEDVLASPYLLVGTVEQIADDLLRRRERLGISYIVVFEPAVESIAPVVARLAGR